MEFEPVKAKIIISKSRNSWNPTGTRKGTLLTPYGMIIDTHVSDISLDVQIYK